MPAHLHAGFRRIPYRPVSKSLKIEVGIEFAVQPHQQVAVKRSSHPGCIVICGQQNRFLFDQIYTQQQAIPWIKSGPHT